eukprot:jgi/Chrzof1/6590/Cz19g01330.t1
MQQESCLEGQCACGKVKLQVSGKPWRQLYCHCRDCQLHSASILRTSIVYKAPVTDAGEQDPFVGTGAFKVLQVGVSNAVHVASPMHHHRSDHDMDEYSTSLVPLPVNPSQQSDIFVVATA